MKTSLEMFKDIEEFEMPDGPNITVKDVVPYFCDKVEQALQRLESIANSEPSEALECVDYIENKLGDLRYECKRTNNHRCDNLFIQENTFTTIKQALIKAQEQEKVLEILVKKRVDINGLKKCIELDLPLTDEQRLHKYNHDYMMIGMEQLNIEEFNLLKRYANEEK